MEKRDDGWMSTLWQHRRMWVIAVGLLAGLLLLLAGGRLSGGEKDGVTTLPTEDMDAYTRELEERLRVLCEKVEGAGPVRVVVTFSREYEYVYAKDEQYSISEGGRTEYRAEYVINGKGNDPGMVYLTRRLPEIAGVGVVCRGGGDEGVRNRLVMLIASALGISSHKIYVVRGEFE